jgi:hypothetical protein
MILGATVGACGSAEESDAGPGESSPPGFAVPSDWTRPGPDYSYTVNGGCGERSGLVGRYRLDVTDGVVTAVSPLSAYGDLRPSEAPTLADLVAEAAAAERNDADEVTVTTSPAGYPRRIFIDRYADGIDDEVCYTVSDVVREPSRIQPWGEPRPAVEWTTDREVRLTTWGSSSCPWVPARVEARGTQSVTVRLEGPGPKAICTTDIAAHRSILDLPSRIDRSAKQLTLVLLARGHEALVVTLDQTRQTHRPIR